MINHVAVIPTTSHGVDFEIRWVWSPYVRQQGA